MEYNDLRSMLVGEMTAAEYIALCSDRLPIPFNLEQGEQLPTIEEVARETGANVVSIEKRRNYYFLPLDSYGQPNGNIETVSVFPADFKIMCENMSYCFENYTDANRRALD